MSRDPVSAWGARLAVRHDGSPASGYREGVATIHAVMGWSMRNGWIKVDRGVRLAVRRWDGDGVPFLLVHGLASNARMWDGVAERLTEVGRDATTDGFFP